MAFSYISLAELFCELKAFIFNDILHISAWVFHRHLKISLPQTELSPSLNFFLLYTFFPGAQGEIWEFALYFSFSFFFISNPFHHLVTQLLLSHCLFIPTVLS